MDVYPYSKLVPGICSDAVGNQGRKEAVEIEEKPIDKKDTNNQLDHPCPGVIISSTGQHGQKWWETYQLELLGDCGRKLQAIDHLYCIHRWQSK